MLRGILVLILEVGSILEEGRTVAKVHRLLAWLGRQNGENPLKIH